MDLNQITPLILTFNESANIARTLAPLQWAEQIIVLDSGSTDGTIDICGRFSNVRVYDRTFDFHAAQWNYGVGVVQTDWVLALDADYVTSAEFAAELEATVVSPGTTVFFADFTYCVFGVPLRATLYPPRAVLFRRDKAHYVQDGHTQLLQSDGRAGHLRTAIRHDDRKPLTRWLQEQDRYATLEARHLLAQPITKLNFQDRLRRKVFFSPAAMFIYLLCIRGLILDGGPGWFYVFQRTLAELLLSLRLLIEKEARHDGGRA
jgi:glycosyltransferase involved in cell wall biosynthesis